MNNKKVRDYWRLCSMFLLRSVILPVRIIVLVLGFFETLTGVSTIVFSHRIDYVSNVLLGVTLIFPFTWLKKSRHVLWYFIILFSSTFLIVFWEYTRNISLGLFPSWSQNVLVTMFIVNLLVVFIYWQYFLDRKKFNPFFSLKQMACIILVIFSLCVYLFFDIHETKNGTKYFDVNGLIFMIPYGSAIDKRWVEPLYTKEAFGNSYTVSNSMTEKNKSLSMKIVIPLKNAGSVDVFENGEKIMRIEYGEKSVKRVVAYDKVSPWGIVGSENIKSWRRDKAGEFHLGTYEYFYKLQEDYDVWIYMEYETSMNEDVEIIINKSIEYPRRTGWKLMPFARKKLPWTVALQTGDRKVDIVKGIEMWY